MINISNYISEFPTLNIAELQPWEITNTASTLVEHLLEQLDSSYFVDNGIALHATATVEDGAVLKPPIILHANCCIAAHAYLREGVMLMPNVTIGPSVEVKSSFIFSNSSVAHFNFLGDSLLGANVNIEAGAIIANYHNDRADKTISVRTDGQLSSIPTTKFGSLIGDEAKIGANSVLNPGTIIEPKEIVDRLHHIDQENL